MAKRMPRTSRTLAAARAPNRTWRPENDRATSRHWLRMYRRVQARPASASPLYHCTISGFRKRTATAANTSATPSHPSSPRTRFIISPLPAPAFAVHGLRGQEQAKGDEAQVIDDVLRVDDAPREVVEVLRDRQIRHDRLGGRPRRLADPVDDPQHQEHREGGHAGDDLVLREARDEQPRRDEAAAHQQEPDVAGG